ncbi:hypothetical protein [Acinetobacter sp. MD2]|uniref:hypothetical protein n=1 Tax=Acinetobacter sp. MD2 TaxID=2600066 RepID=UPI002D1EA23C|nr:hypothetical protein [Acinetobacter sp. MD2]MEB3766577.1 hypothetical protein [Acinetobacter sp. MD2]
MSYKHNNLMAMRLRYWQEASISVQNNKQSLKVFLEQQQLFSQVSEDELEYFFFSLPSHVVMRAHSLGFDHHQVMAMMTTHIATHRQQLSCRKDIKIKYRL